MILPIASLNMQPFASVSMSRGWSNVVVILIVVAGSYGVLSSLRSIFRIGRQTKRLNNDFIPKLRDTRVDAAFLQQWVATMKKDHLSERIETMLATLAKEGRGEKMLPQLQDMHELTLQRESSRTSGMHTIISILLIMGILGTLLGIHACIEDGITNIADIRPALKPSMLAVFGMVILMVLRGGYTFAVDRYLALLDEVTMTQLIPILQPCSNLHNTLNSLCGSLSQFGSGMEHFTQSSNALEASVSEFSAASTILTNTSGQIKSMIGDVCAVTQKVHEHVELQSISLAATKQGLDQLNQDSQPLQQACLEMKDGIDSFRASVLEMHRQYQELGVQVRDAVTDIAISRDALYRLADMAHALEERSNAIGGYQDDLKKIAGAQNQLEECLATIRQEYVCIGEISDVLRQALSHMVTDSERVAHGMQQICEMGRKFEHDLQLSRESVRYHVAGAEAEFKKMSGYAVDLVHEMRKRAQGYSKIWNLGKNKSK